MEEVMDDNNYMNNDNQSSGTPDNTDVFGQSSGTANGSDTYSQPQDTYSQPTDTYNQSVSQQESGNAYAYGQCGFCSPGFIISAKVLLDNNPSPTREEVRDWFNKQRNLCRCTGYKPLIDATMAAAAVMRGEMTKEEVETEKS